MDNRTVDAETPAIQPSRSDEGVSVPVSGGPEITQEGGQTADRKMPGSGPYLVETSQYDNIESRYRLSETPPEVFIRQQAALERRIAREKAHYEQGFPIAGHDPRDRGKGRGR
ncbi:hypothetical protein [Methylobacterium sp. WSM2598]|uniref:hypothetical protein n=1 Tax=Methylobacterium sp. WSM2598 TaxID=398261 RepID=UPI00035E7F54|nr:hypothetical protein [Methylobacterium sp. WSM2598]